MLFVCHHPLDWLLDADQVTANLNARSRDAQLFGHKHAQVIDETNNCLRLVAGAVIQIVRSPNGDRAATAWDSRSSALAGIDNWPSTCIHECGARTNRSSFRLRALRWQKSTRTYVLKLPEWEAPTDVVVAPTVSQPAYSTTTAAGVDSMDPARTLTCRFLSLPHIVRLDIAQRMKLLRKRTKASLTPSCLSASRPRKRQRAWRSFGISSKRTMKTNRLRIHMRIEDRGLVHPEFADWYPTGIR